MFNKACNLYSIFIMLPVRYLVPLRLVTPVYSN